MSDEQIPPAPPDPPASDPPPPDPPAPPPAAPPPPPPSGGPPSGASENRTVFLVLSYLGVLALIPFFMEKEDKEVNWHAKHGLVLLATWFVLAMGLYVVSMTIDVFGCLGCFGSSFVGLAYLIISIVCIVKALNGERFKIPVVSDFVDKF